jgi:hypothetical protein
MTKGVAVDPEPRTKIPKPTNLREWIEGASQVDEARDAEPVQDDASHDDLQMKSASRPHIVVRNSTGLPRSLANETALPTEESETEEDRSIDKDPPEGVRVAMKRYRELLKRILNAA